MATTRECACPRCSRGVPDGTSLVSERTWFYHNQGRVWGGRRGRKRPREARSAAPADSDAGVGAGAGASGNPTECGGASAAAPAPTDTAALPATRSEGAAAYAQPAAAAASSPRIGLNGVCVPRSVFCERVDNYVAYTFIHKHRLSREATLEYLSQRSRRGTSRPAKTLRDFVRASVDLHERRVDCCRNGCAAFVARRSELDACDVCGAARRLADGTPIKQAVYWSLSSWLLTMLADPKLGRSMTAAMSDAIKAAKVPVDGVRDWYDGMTFREAVAAGLIHSDTCVALSISVDGFEAWRQRGFQGWPIVLTVLSVQPGERSVPVLPVGLFKGT